MLLFTILFLAQNTFADIKPLSVDGMVVDPHTGVVTCDVQPLSCAKPPPNCFPKSLNVSGHKIVSKFEKGRSAAREAQIESSFLSGYMPYRLKSLRSIKIQSQVMGALTEIKFFVTPDYLAIGNNYDYVRIPMTNKTAQGLGDRFGMTLPTDKMVDEIYFVAPLKITASPFGESENHEHTDDFRSVTRLFIKSDNEIAKKIYAARFDSTYIGDFIAGHKKDVILDPQPGFVSIYGWACDPRSEICNVEDGRMPHIQNVNDHQHSSAYVDYSHGIRFVNKWAYVSRIQNGYTVCQPQRLENLLADPDYCPLISNHCPLPPEQARAYIPK